MPTLAARLLSALTLASVHHSVAPLCQEGAASISRAVAAAQPSLHHWVACRNHWVTPADRAATCVRHRVGSGPILAHRGLQDGLRRSETGTASSLPRQAPEGPPTRAAGKTRRCEPSTEATQRSPLAPEVRDSGVYGHPSQGGFVPAFWGFRPRSGDVVRSARRSEIAHQSLFWL